MQKKQNLFTQFLKRTKDSKNVDTIFQVLANHGALDYSLEYARIVGKYDKIIVHYINK